MLMKHSCGQSWFFLLVNWTRFTTYILRTDSTTSQWWWGIFLKRTKRERKSRVVKERWVLPKNLLVPKIWCSSRRMLNSSSLAEANFATKQNMWSKITHCKISLFSKNLCTYVNVYQWVYKYHSFIEH